MGGCHIHLQWTSISEHGWVKKFTTQGLPSQSGRSLMILIAHGLKLRKWVVLHSYHVLEWILDNFDLILRVLTMNNSCQDKKWSCKENREAKFTSTEQHSVVKKSSMTDSLSINSETLIGRGEADLNWKEHRMQQACICF